jgi:hypothetical protein
MCRDRLAAASPGTIRLIAAAASMANPILAIPVERTRTMLIAIPIGSATSEISDRRSSEAACCRTARRFALPYRLRSLRARHTTPPRPRLPRSFVLASIRPLSSQSPRARLTLRRAPGNTLKSVLHNHGARAKLVIEAECHDRVLGGIAVGKHTVRREIR